MKAISILVLSVILLSSCRNPGKDIVAYAKDKENGLRKEIKAGMMVYDFQYRPKAYTLKMEQLQEGTAAYKERSRALDGTIWINISFHVEGSGQSPLRYGAGSLEEYTQRQDYYLNQAVKDITLTYGGTNLYPASYWFENNQNLAAHETMIVAFALPDRENTPGKDITVSFRDQVFNNGIIKTTFKKEDLLEVADL